MWSHPFRISRLWRRVLCAVALGWLAAAILLTGSPPSRPSAYSLERQAAHRLAEQSEAAEEEARQASYAAQPGAPYPTESFNP
jgi:hypothetical protein